MKTYGLTKNDLSYIRQKIDNQRTYLESNHITTDNGQVKSLLDLSFSANHSVRYYAQLSNKINTMETLACQEGNVGHFLTCTLDGFFRDFLKGDFTRFNNFNDVKKEEVIKSLPEDDIRGHLRSKVLNAERFTVKDLYNALNYQMKRFLQSYAFKKLKRDNLKYSYIKTVEPHSDGVPHFHMMLYIPQHHRELFKKYFIESFPAPQNRKKLKDYKGQLKGFQWNIDNASGYIMKYITKSFMDVKNRKEIDYMQAWYIKHGIMRVSSSRSTVPQWVYQKCLPVEKDWYRLSSILNDVDSHAEWSREDDFFHFIDNHTKRELKYDRGLYQVMYNGKVVKTIGEKREKKYKYDNYEKVPNTWKSKPLLKRNFELHVDGKNYGDYHYMNKTVVKTSKKPYEMNNYEIVPYFNNLDKDKVDPNHYIFTRNLIIARGLMEGELKPLDAHYNPFNFDNEILQDVQIKFEASEVF